MPRPTRFARRALLLACTAALISGIGGCSSDSGTSEGSERSTTTTAASTSSTTAAQRTPIDPEASPEEEQAYAAALLSIYQDDETGPPFPDDQLRCIATEWVSIIGVDRFEEAGASPEDIAGGSVTVADVGLDEPLAEELTDAMVVCGVDLRETIFGSVGEGATMPEDVKECLYDIVSAEDARDIYVQRLLGSTEAPASFAGVPACLEGLPSPGG